MADDDLAFVVCVPCLEVRHDDCLGALVWCECFAEVLMEAEAMDDE